MSRQAPLSMGFPRQESWSGLPFSSPGDLPDPEIEPMSPLLATGFFTAELLLRGCVSHFNCVQLFATPWTEAHQTPLSMGFSRQEHWSGLPFPFPGDLPNPGIKPTFLVSLALQADSLPLCH